MEQFHRSFMDATLDDLAEIREFVELSVIELGAPEEAAGELVLAVNEAAANIIVHGYGDRKGDITIEIKLKDGAMLVSIRDYSPPFDPRAVPKPDVTIPLDQRPYGGMGVHMMRSFTDEVDYKTSNKGENELVLVKKLVRSPGK